MAERLRATLRGQKGAVTHLLYKFEVIQADDKKFDDLQTIEDALRAKLQTITNLHESILHELPDDELEQEILDQEDYIFQIQSQISKLCKFKQVKLFNLNANSQVYSVPARSATDNAILSTNEHVYTPPDNSRTSVPTASNSSIYHRLPKLDLPKFDGDILEWQSFWDSYDSAIHSNGSISNVQKFTYLRSCLRYNALQTVAGFALTHANYEKAVALLHERYGQKDLIVQTHIKALLEVPAPLHTANSLRHFYDTTETYICALKSLDQHESTYGSLLTPVILQKLPSQIRQNMTRAHGSQTWCLPDLMRCLLSEILILNAGAPFENNLSSEVTMPTATFLTKSENQKTMGRDNATGSKPKIDNEKTCVFCKGHHSCTDCKTVTEPKQRQDIVKKRQLCFNCLGPHKVLECKSRFKCRKCHKRHHTSLCNGKPSSSIETLPVRHSATETHTSVLHSAHSVVTGPVLLKTAVATVSTTDVSCEANILFDEGSQSSFITERMAEKLELRPTRKQTICLSGFGDKERHVRHLDTAVIYIDTETEKMPVTVLIVPEISAPLTSHTYESRKYPYLKNLRLAHPITKDDEFDIQLLIGADFYWSIVQDNIVRGNGPTAIQSKIGYLLSGPLHQSTTTNDTPRNVSMMKVLTMHVPEEIDIERFWKCESMGVEPVTKQNDEYLRNYQNTCISYQDGKYYAKLPWKDDHEPLPTNEAICRRRTEQVIRKLEKEPFMLTKYAKIIEDQEQRGFIEQVPAEELRTQNRVHYLPHHAVKKDSATTPIRIVYDCSCKSSRDSPSLNDCLMNIPPHLNDVTAILMRFRCHRYAITTDIEKAFLNVGLHRDDRDVTRFYWLSDPSDPKSKLQTYRFKSVLFGATCSPFILNATIMKHLEHNPCHVTDLLQRGLYVDNILASVANEQTLIEFYRSNREIFKQANFNLRSWCSNSKTLLTMFKADGTAVVDKDTKTLGMRWDPESDMMYFPQRAINVQNDKQLTKREVLKESSSVFDPLGLLSPVTVRSKVLIQSLWQRGLEWDQILPDEIISEWVAIRNDVTRAMNLQLDRCYFHTLITENSSTVLHVFTDASMKAYGACAYLVRNDQSTLVMAKNRVAPIKELTIPKLELCAAVVGARLCNHITSHIECDNVTLWSDSQITLHWISSSKKQNVFVQNRVREIRELTTGLTWKYCPTNSNPADLLSRGLSYEKFHDNSLWFKGPQWLTNEAAFPNTIIQPTENFKDNVVLLADDKFIPGILHDLDLTRFSSYQKMLRVCAYVCRFIDYCKGVKTNERGIQPREINTAAKLIIKHEQNRSFPDEVNYLTTKRSNNTKPALVRQLNLFIDEDGLIRCEGRIANAPLPDNARFPYLLPSRGKLTDLIITDAHKTQLHSGIESTVTYLRQSFCIPSIRQRVRNVIRSCITCRRVTGPSYRAPDPPPLPQDRLKQAPPFTVTGVDFTGALNVKATDGRLQKVYICLFTCANTRAIHLEIVPSMTVEAFIMAFRRFVSRRAIPKVIMSDNALTFIATAKLLKDELLNHHNITWKVIPQHAPWYGGWWERLIGVTKSCVKKILGKALVTLETLQTIITEVECIINDRPLTHIPGDLSDGEPLTPSHLLYGRRITSPVYPVDQVEEADSISRKNAVKLYRFRTAILGQFWDRWKHEYLTSLREFHRRSGRDCDDVRVGDVVHIYDDHIPRSRWSLGVIDSVLPGADGRVRAARVRCQRGTTTRPITKLYPLELRD